MERRKLQSTNVTLLMSEMTPKECLRDPDQPGREKVAFQKIFMELRPTDLVKPRDGTLPVRKVEHQPTYERYRALHDEVGRPWNWHLRPRIHNRPIIEAELAHSHTQFGVFSDKGREIGYYLLVSDDGRDVELSDFGFLPTDRGRGFGKQALWELATSLFATGVTRIWLSTRSTNDPRVFDFYSQMGFREYKREDKVELLAGSPNKAT